jgi:hypothetical protein
VILEIYHFPNDFLKLILLHFFFIVLAENRKYYEIMTIVRAGAFALLYDLQKSACTFHYSLHFACSIAYYFQTKASHKYVCGAGESASAGAAKFQRDIFENL